MLWRYLLKRVGFAILVLFVLSLFVFALFYIAPGTISVV